MPRHGPETPPRAVPWGASPRTHAPRLPRRPPRHNDRQRADDALPRADWRRAPRRHPRRLHADAHARLRPRERLPLHLRTAQPGPGLRHLLRLLRHARSRRRRLDERVRPGHQRRALLAPVEGRPERPPARRLAHPVPRPRRRELRAQQLPLRRDPRCRDRRRGSGSIRRSRPSRPRTSTSGASARRPTPARRTGAGSSRGRTPAATSPAPPPTSPPSGSPSSAASASATSCASSSPRSRPGTRRTP